MTLTFILINRIFYHMGLFDKVSKRKSTNNYIELSESDVNLTNQDKQIKFFKITSQNNLINVEKELSNENILLLDISQINQTKISVEYIYDELERLKEIYNCNVLHKSNNDLIIVTPYEIAIDKEIHE